MVFITKISKDHGYELFKKKVNWKKNVKNYIKFGAGKIKIKTY